MAWAAKGSGGNGLWAAEQRNAVEAAEAKEASKVSCKSLYDASVLYLWSDVWLFLGGGSGHWRNRQRWFLVTTSIGSKSFPLPHPIQKKPNPLKVSRDFGEKQHHWVPNCQATVSVVSVDLRKFAVLGKGTDSGCFSKQNPESLGATPVLGQLSHLSHIHTSPGPQLFLYHSNSILVVSLLQGHDTLIENDSIIWSPSSW